MKNIQALISFLLIGSIVMNIVLLLTLRDLPDDIKNSINSSQYNLLMGQQKKVEKKVEIKEDSIRIITATLPIKGDLVFFEGKMIEEGVKLRDVFEWQADDPLPAEIWNGYIHLIKSKNGGRYYLWADWKIPKTDANIKGWFTTFTHMKFDVIQGKGEEYVNLLVPVVREKEMREGI